MLEVIPVMRPKLPGIDKFTSSFLEIEKNRIYSNNGPLLDSLRREYSNYLGVSAELLVPMVNATLAIQGCMEILDQRDWILPDYSFAATCHAATGARKIIYLADVKKEDFQLEIPSDLQRENFGCLPVMPFGAPITFENWQGFNSLVIDAAASLGAIPPDFNKMPHNTMVVFSLHATKIFGAGEGALVVCKNLDLAEKLRAWSNFGFRNSRVADSGGTNAKMSEFTAAIALASIRDRKSEIDSWNSRLEYARQLDYPNEFRTIVENYPGIRPYWIIQLENLHQKQKMIEHLALNMVETRSWWSTTLSTMPAFTQLKKIINTINSKYFSEIHLGLPLWQDISDEQLQHIAKCLKSFNS